MQECSKCNNQWTITMHQNRRNYLNCIEATLITASPECISSLKNGCSLFIWEQYTANSYIPKYSVFIQCNFKLFLSNEQLF